MGNRNSPLVPKGPAIHIDVLGESFVGKSCLARTYDTGVFKENTHLRIGADIHFKILDVQNNTIELRIWNIMGPYGYLVKVLPVYVPFADGALLLYDVTNIQSFLNLPELLETVRKLNPRAVIFIIGAKCDLWNDKKVSRETAQKYARSEKLEFFECSAKTGKNVKEIFEHMALKILQKKGLIYLDKIKMEGKSLEWRETKVIPDSSDAEEEIFNGSVTENEILNIPASDEKLNNSKQPAVLVEVAASHFLQEAKLSLPQLTTNSLLEDSDNFHKLFQNSSVGCQTVGSEQESENLKTVSPSIQDGNALTREAADFSASTITEENISTSDDKKDIRKETGKSLLSEEEMLQEGKCPL